MKQTRKKQKYRDDLYEKVSTIRNAFFNTQTRRRPSGGAELSSKNLLLASIAYGKKLETPIIPAGFDVTTPDSEILKKLLEIMSKNIPPAVVATVPVPGSPSSSPSGSSSGSPSSSPSTTSSGSPSGSPSSSASGSSPPTTLTAEQIAKAKLKTEQLTIVLPFFLQIYESLYNDTNYGGKTKIKRYTKIPNKAIMEYAIKQIRIIEDNHPHPELFESIFYFWSVFNLSTALNMLMSYLVEIPDGTSEGDVPGRLVTIVEKQLGNTSSFTEWDNSMTKPHDYRVYTKLYGQKFNPIRYADSALIALSKNAFSTYNPFISRRDIDIKVNDETGQFESEKTTTHEKAQSFALPKTVPTA